jgi:hypothetical protein
MDGFVAEASRMLVPGHLRGVDRRAGLAGLRPMGVKHQIRRCLATELPAAYREGLLDYYLVTATLS